MTDHSNINSLIDHLFRHESGKMVAVLTRIFGTENIELAEDVVQDALVEAIKNWTYKGVPENPSAWLYKVAKNKALNIVNRDKYKKQYVSESIYLLHSPWTAEPAADNMFSDEAFQSDQLRMMFICCHHSISQDSQIALILKTLCGFGIHEIAKAFLTSNENINKRLVRARKKIRDTKIPFELPQEDELGSRLQAVLEAIYLLFNEGYNASSGNQLIRYELCEEAIKLCEILISHPIIKNKSDVYALLALMQLNASRFKSREDEEGNILTLDLQDRTLWEVSLIKEGLINLKNATYDGELSTYHILASISAYHCLAKDFELTDWDNILALYDKLVKINNSPIVLLNRAVALSKVNGPEDAISELNKLNSNQALISYHLFYSILADLYEQMNEFMKASEALEKALELTSQKSEKKLLEKRLARCREKISQG